MTEFLAAYDAQLARWPAGTETIDAPSRYGRTRVIACGPRGGAPLVLLSGGGATATAWFAVAAELAGHRLYAVDRLGDAGRSVPLGAPLRTRARRRLRYPACQAVDQPGPAGGAGAGSGCRQVDTGSNACTPPT